MMYKVTERHCHGAISCGRYETLAEAKREADRLQAIANTHPDDGWGSYWTVTRSGWYPGERVGPALYETTRAPAPVVLTGQGEYASAWPEGGAA